MKVALMCGCKGDRVSGQYFYCLHHNKAIKQAYNESPKLADKMADEIIHKINHLSDN